MPKPSARLLPAGLGCGGLCSVGPGFFAPPPGRHPGGGLLRRGQEAGGCCSCPLDQGPAAELPGAPLTALCHLIPLRWRRCWCRWSRRCARRNPRRRASCLGPPSTGESIRVLLPSAERSQQVRAPFRWLGRASTTGTSQARRFLSWPCIAGRKPTTLAGLANALRLEPAETLIDYYKEAEAATGIEWEVLAAVKPGGIPAMAANRMGFPWPMPRGRCSPAHQLGAGGGP